MNSTHANEPIKNNTSCIMYDLHAKASNILREIKSDHAISITNDSGTTKTYHVKYQNYILYSGPYYSQLAVNEFDVTLLSGERKDLNNLISEKAYFSVKGTYPLLCSTVIKLNNKTINSIESKNYAYIE
jgi:hypothetical protein